MGRAYTRLWSTASLLLISGCGGSPTDQEADLPPADPGYLLSVPAPGYGTSLDWDIQSNRLIVGEQKLWSIDPATHSMTELPADISATVTPAILYLRVSRLVGAIFITAPQTDGTNILSRLDRGAALPEQIARSAAQEIGISSNGRWLLYATMPTNAVTRLDIQTGERTPIAPTNWAHPYVLSDDGRLAVVLVCSTPGATCQLAIMDIETRAYRVVETPEPVVSGSSLILGVAAFVGNELVVLIARITDAHIAYFEWNESTKAERPLGAIPVPTSGGCEAWSPATHSLVAVRGLHDATYRHGELTQRFGVYAIGAGTSTLIRTADLFQPTACSVSPDGRWFVYGNSTGYLTGDGRRLYLTSVP